VYSRFTRPRKFERNVIVIGRRLRRAGFGLHRGRREGKSDIDREHRMGGDCLNTGCGALQKLIRSAKCCLISSGAREFGVRRPGLIPVRRRNGARAAGDQAVDRTISVERYTTWVWRCIKGEAKLVSPWESAVNGKILTTRSIGDAAAPAPSCRDFGVEKIGHLTSDTVWNLASCPSAGGARGGPIGCELAQFFARLGSKVTQVKCLPRIIDPRRTRDSEMCWPLPRRSVDVAARAQGQTVPVENGAGADLRAQWRTLRIPVQTEVLLAGGRNRQHSRHGLESWHYPYPKPHRGDQRIPCRHSPEHLRLRRRRRDLSSSRTLQTHQAWYAAVNALSQRQEVPPPMITR